MRKNTGFTLIELLAVIVILSIVSLITIPIILGVIQRTQTASYKESLRSVFSATDLYIASSKFEGFPQNGINVTDENIRLKNKTFTSGKIIKNEEDKIELQKVSDGTYCGSGTLENLVVIEGSCDELDTTPPIITIGSNLVTSNSITVVASAEDLESGINGYQFSSDNGTTWTSKQTSNVHTFSELTTNTNYIVKVRVYNNNLLSTESNSLELITANIPTPTYSIDVAGWTQQAAVTISYPERQPGYKYEYSLDEGITWREVISPATTKGITFNANGSVIARISDGVNIISGTTYEVINVDTTAPIITVTPLVVNIVLNSSYTDAGVTASDNAEGDITSRIVTTGTVNTEVEGAYMLTYNVNDTAGNVAQSVTRTVNVIQTEYTFDYIGSVQTFTVPATGNYKLELWGAQGGKHNNYTAIGGKGGYSTGKINLVSGQTLNIYVGGLGLNSSSYIGAGGGWNGGGTGGNSASSYSNGGAGGGGATDIRMGGTELSNRIIVAGGGAGAGANNTPYGDPGVGGGLTGGSPYYQSNGCHIPFASGGTQSSGGNYGGYCSGHYGTSGTLGIGGRGGGGSISNAGGGGGGGYYGGGGGGASYGGGGGASYINGVSNGLTIAGDQSMPDISGGTMIGKTGNGYAKITFISQ